MRADTALTYKLRATPQVKHLRWRQSTQAELMTWACRPSWERGGVPGPSPWSPWSRDACDPSLQGGIEAGQEDAALAHLKEHLSWHVQPGRHSDTCAGVGKNGARTRRCSRAAAAV